LLDDTDGFAAELCLFEIHEFRDETNIGRDALPPFEDESVGT
jgi:hypothetical protein